MFPFYALLAVALILGLKQLFRKDAVRIHLWKDLHQGKTHFLTNYSKAIELRKIQ